MAFLPFLQELFTNEDWKLKKLGTLKEDFVGGDRAKNSKSPYRCSVVPGYGLLVGKVTVNEKLGMLQLENNFGQVFIALVVDDYWPYALSYGFPFICGWLCWLCHYKVVKEEFEDCPTQVYLLCSPQNLRLWVPHTNPSVELSPETRLHQWVLVRGKSLPFSYTRSDPIPKRSSVFLMDCILIGRSSRIRMNGDDDEHDHKEDAYEKPRLLAFWGKAARYYPFIQVGCRYKISVPFYNGTSVFHRE